MQLPSILVGATLLALLVSSSLAQQTPAAAPASTEADAKAALDKKYEFKDFLLQDGAFSVAAAGLAGVADTAITTVDNTRDAAVYLKAFSPENKGGGFVLAPARARSPFPRISRVQYEAQGVEGYWWRALTSATVSYAQGTNEIDAKSYRRRAVALSTQFYFDHKNDDPISVGLELAHTCYKKFIAPKSDGKSEYDVFMPTIGLPEAERKAAAEKQLKQFSENYTAYYAICAKPAMDALQSRWYRGQLTLVLAGGDIKQDQAGGASASLGTHAALAVRLGGAISTRTKLTANEPTFADSGWAFTLSGRLGRNEPVISTLGSSSIQKRDTSLVAARLALGTDSIRALAEASNAKATQASTGELSLRRAVGIEYRLAKGVWLHARYGNRALTTNGQTERAGLMTVNWSPEPADVAAWFGK